MQMERPTQTFAIAMAVALGTSPQYFLHSMKDEYGRNMARRTVMGLQIQVRDEHGQFKCMSTGVPQAPAAIVNTGTMLARWTNDFWTATNHRVVAESEMQASMSRYSIVFFINPRGDTMIQPDASFLKRGEKEKYDPITADEYLSMRLDRVRPAHK